MKPIVVLGSLNMDLVVRTPRLPTPGETLIGGPFQTFPGGKGANQAVAVARLGAPVFMIGRVGCDAFGQELIAAAARDGVDTRGISQDPEAATGVALITVEASGQNTIIVVAGANYLISPQHIEPYSAFIRQASLLVMQLEIPLETVQAAARLARQAGVPVLLNPAPAQPLPQDLLRNIDLLAPNQSELALLAGGGSIESAAQSLIDQGVSTVLVTLGDQGAFVLDREGRTSAPAFSVSAVDAVAAGDAFIGAFAVALSEGKTVLEAARWGNAAGAIAVTRHGAQPSLPRRDEVVAMLEGRRFGERHNRADDMSR